MWQKIELFIKFLQDFDLIAMNALYRPGPIEYIPSFIKRKHGHEDIKYVLPETPRICQN